MKRRLFVTIVGIVIVSLFFIGHIELSQYIGNQLTIENGRMPAWAIALIFGLFGLPLGYFFLYVILYVIVALCSYVKNGYTANTLFAFICRWKDNVSAWVNYKTYFFQ